MRITRSFYPDADRYALDFGACSYAKGYAQIDSKQDASYYGSWCSPEKLKIVNYCEGDLTITTADSKEEFAKLIREHVEWCDGAGYGPTKIDVYTTPALKKALEDMGLADVLH